MKNLISISALTIITLFGMSSCVSRYYIVRHAEKDTSLPDIPGPNGQILTDLGNIRARVLCDSLRNKGIRQIFVSQYLRTQLTAAPTARALGLTATEYDANAEIQILANQLRSIGDHSVLVVGHSNTVPKLIYALTGTSLGYVNDEIPGHEFDNFFIVKRYRGLGPVTYTLERRGKYGALSTRRP